MHLQPHEQAGDLGVARVPGKYLLKRALEHVAVWFRGVDERLEARPEIADLPGPRRFGRHSNRRLGPVLRWDGSA
jgi:hypothetical protein